MASNLQHVASYLPPSDGLLPKWLLFISVVSIANSIQAYISLAPTRQVYAGASPDPSLSTTSASNPASTNQKTALPAGVPARTLRQPQSSPVNELSARTFGTWTALSSIIRLYAAYHIHEAAVYELALWTFGLAFVHFTSEWLVFGTARWGRGLAGPVFVSTITGTWMWLQWGDCVR
ncbi:hypothetical protein KC315_g1754 [Hortaea werneckii]|nr:hypothetical protein KC315_g1754 [Hortaea werneckii]